jgi:hypothetical protein
MDVKVIGREGTDGIHVSGDRPVETNFLTG